VGTEAQPTLGNYELEQALKLYQSNAYTEINKYLRGEVLITDMMEDEQDALKVLLEAFKPGGRGLETRDTMIVYRGVGRRPTAQLRNLDVGDTYSQPGFLSTSTDTRIALESFASPGYEGDAARKKIMLEIVVPEMTKTLPMSYIRQRPSLEIEKEILLGPGLHLQIIEIVEKSDHFLYTVMVVGG
jgi:hypothetical protein